MLSRCHCLKLLILSALSLTLLACGQPTDKNQLVVYSARAEHLIKPLFDAYTEETGIEIAYTTDNAGSLLARLRSEGATTPADLLLTVDVGNLHHAKLQEVLRPLDSSVLQQNIPPHLRDPDNVWFGLTSRARIIVYDSERVSPDELNTYAGLADEQWRDRLCLRTSKKVYNQSLVAAFLAHYGEEKTSKIIRGWVDNLAVAPFSNDTSTMQAVIAGQCDVAVVNTYYYGALEAQGKAGNLKIFWPNQDRNGVHINVSGAGLTRHSRNPIAAQAFLEWLSGEKAQTMLAGLNLEFPVNPNVQAVEQVQAWGEFKADTLSLSEIAGYQVQAVQLIDRLGYQ